MGRRPANIHEDLTMAWSPRTKRVRMAPSRPPNAMKTLDHPPAAQHSTGSTVNRDSTAPFICRRF